MPTCAPGGRCTLGRGRRGPRASPSLAGRSFALSPLVSLYLRVFPSISPYLPVSPRISPYLPVSPRISPYLRAYPVSPVVDLVSPGISPGLWSLPVSPSLPRYPAVSRGIPPYLAMDTVKNIIQTSESSVWPFEALSARTRHSPHPTATHGAHATHTAATAHRGTALPLWHRPLPAACRDPAARAIFDSQRNTVHTHIHI